jgi:hypothetical protein
VRRPHALVVSKFREVPIHFQQHFGRLSIGRPMEGCSPCTEDMVSLAW